MFLRMLAMPAVLLIESPYTNPAVASKNISSYISLSSEGKWRIDDHFYHSNVYTAGWLNKQNPHLILWRWEIVPIQRNNFDSTQIP